MMRVALISVVCALVDGFAPSALPRLASVRRHAAESPADIAFGELDGTNARIGIIKTRWNQEIISGLRDGIVKTLGECGVQESNIFETEVPGSFELPMAARFLALSQTVDAVICVGCLVKGDTMHFEYISQATASGIMNVQLQTSVPCVFGVLTCNTEEQAKSRSSGTNNHGPGWAKTAVEMAQVRMSAMSGRKPQTINLSGSEPSNSTQMDPPRKVFF